MAQARALPKGILGGINAGGSAIGAGLGVQKSSTTPDVVALPDAGGEIWGVTMEELPADSAAAGSCQTGGRAVAKSGAAIPTRGPVQVNALGKFIPQAGGRCAGYANTITTAADQDFELDIGMGSQASGEQAAGLYVEQTIGHADLVAAATTETKNLGAPVPAGATIQGVSFPSFTPFSGGSVSNLVVDIGDAGDVDAIRDGVDVDTAAVGGQPSTAPLGIAPNKFYPTATQLLLTFIATGDNTVNLSAGSITVRVYYTV